MSRIAIVPLVRLLRCVAGGIALLGGLTAVQPAGAAPASGDGSCLAGAGPFVTVRVDGLRAGPGPLKLEIYPADEADFLRDDIALLRKHKTFRRSWAPAPTTSSALLFVHSRSGRVKFDIWSDGAGVAGSRRLGRAKPTVAEAAIDVAPQGVSVNVSAQYLAGIGGFKASR
ncbi:hypothetical protein DC429_15100 [Arthrobacter sp. TPD3018]|uniref:hypothetical protein n=1 Tax=Bacteria TaxID=2 RepID=UPI000D519EE8|nr:MULTISPECIES: hypothetical protein [Bacteria]PVE52670.1 hypothetical protein DC425_14475 [Sphingomonas sp. TPD3009]PVE52853.1 hypothetical protein DC429_15100 [Arthrobacter sp. TPD3018]PVE81242.1 hypothetical protein DC431_14480 [Sphingomonas melonis]